MHGSGVILVVNLAADGSDVSVYRRLDDRGREQSPAHALWRRAQARCSASEADGAGRRARWWLLEPAPLASTATSVATEPGHPALSEQGRGPVLPGALVATWDRRARRLWSHGRHGRQRDGASDLVRYSKTTQGEACVVIGVEEDSQSRRGISTTVLSRGTGDPPRPDGSSWGCAQTPTASTTDIV